MPKLKTKKILTKKIKVSGTGKIMTSHQLRSGHYRKNKSSSALRRHHVPKQMSSTIDRTMRQLLGIGGKNGTS